MSLNLQKEVHNANVPFSTSPMDWMLSHGVMTWLIICTVRINDELENGAVAVQAGIMSRSVTRVIITPQYLGTVCLYECLHWNQQPK